MGFKNPRGVTIDEDTWQKLEQLQKMTGLSKSKILKNLLLKELRNLEGKNVKNS